MKPTVPQINFEFIVSTPSYNASESKETRTFVRKHVMRPHFKKKHYGRSVQLQEEALAEYLTKRQFRSEPPLQTDFSFFAGSPSNAAALLGAARVNPFDTYPISMEAKDRELVHHVWASREVNFQPFRDYWFSLGMVDPAAMHLVLSNAAKHLNHLRGGRIDDVTVLTHDTAALQSVNNRMADSKQNTTDEIIGAILGHLALRYDRCATHMAGLRQILVLRGGQSSIDSNKYIRLSLFWIEHNIAMDLDTIPTYPPPFHLIQRPFSAEEYLQGLSHRDKAISVAGLSTLLSVEMLDILLDLSVLNETLKVESAARNIWDDPDYVGFRVYPTLYKLLAAQATPQQDKIQNLVHEICRLGSILFLTEIRRKFGVSPVVTDSQIAKMRAIFESIDMIWDQRLERIRTWALVVASFAASREADRIWAMQTLVQPWSFLTWPYWDEKITLVSNLWWIDGVFSSARHKFHDQYTKNSTNEVNVGERVSTMLIH